MYVSKQIYVNGGDGDGGDVGWSDGVMEIS